MVSPRIRGALTEPSPRVAGFVKQIRAFFEGIKNGPVTTGRIYHLQFNAFGARRRISLLLSELKRSGSPHIYSTRRGEALGGSGARRASPDGNCIYWPQTASSKRKSKSRRAREWGFGKVISENLCQDRKSDSMFTLFDYTSRTSNKQIWQTFRIYAYILPWIYQFRLSPGRGSNPIVYPRPPGVYLTPPKEALCTM